MSVRPVQVPVTVFHVSTKEEFQSTVYPARRPTILRGVELGRAPELWSPEYLCQHCGSRPVKIHVCPVAQMDFLTKNFAYKTLPFDEFVKRASREIPNHFYTPDEKYYLRALGDDPRKDIANFHTQFPSLAKDITLPMFCEPEQYFSSVLRVGSPGVQLWTHYDVMDNLLVQVTGRKKVVLFSPREATNLYLLGDKSQVLDIDNPDLSAYPRFASAQRHECYLEPGDVLFIPALWFHNVVALDFGVAVNIFWKQLEAKFYDSKDTYGNKDPPQAQRAMQVVDRAVKMLEELPEEYRDFYARCLVARIESKAYSTGLT